MLPPKFLSNTYTIVSHEFKDLGQPDLPDRNCAAPDNSPKETSRKVEAHGASYFPARQHSSDAHCPFPGACITNISEGVDLGQFSQGRDHPRALAFYVFTGRDRYLIQHGYVYRDGSVGRNSLMHIIIRQTEALRQLMGRAQTRNVG